MKTGMTAWTGAILGFAAVIVHVMPVAARAESSDPLTAYRLTRPREGQFSPHDKKAAPFWTEWERFGLDRIVLLCPAGDPGPDTGSGGTGELDAEMTVFAAYGLEGLYLLCSISDDRFIRQPAPAAMADSADEWKTNPAPSGPGGDAVVVYLNQSIAPATVDPDRRAGGGRYTALYGRVSEEYSDPEIVVVDDPSTVPDTASNGPPPGYPGGSPDTAMESRKINAGGDDGIRIETGRTPDGRFQEWLIPWPHVGLQGIPERGERIEFAIAYRDVDPDSGTDGNLLSGQSQGGPAHGEWGEIEFGLLLDEVITVHILPVRSFHPAGASIRSFRLYRANGQCFSPLDRSPWTIAIGARRPVSNMLHLFSGKK